MVTKLYLWLSMVAGSALVESFAHNWNTTFECAFWSAATLTAMQLQQFASKKVGKIGQKIGQTYKDTGDMSADDAPDWMPQGSAIGAPEGERRYSSVGQLWQVRNQQWVRIRKPADVK